MKRLIILLLLVPFWGMAQTVKEPSAGGFDDPMTTRGDIIIRDATNATARLAVGTSGQVLTTDGTDVSWGDVYSDPLTTAGDIPYYGAAGTTRLAAGSEGQVLTMGATYPEWAAASGGDSSYFDLTHKTVSPKSDVDTINFESEVFYIEGNQLYTDPHHSSGVMIGDGAGELYSHGANNIGIGKYALRYLNTTGIMNLAIGTNSLNKLTTGDQNVCLGVYTGSEITTQEKNVGVGVYSLSVNTGDNNTAIGAYSGYTGDGSSNVFVGYYAGYYETGSNKLYIENSNSATPLIGGDFSVDRVDFNGSTKQMMGTTVEARDYTVERDVTHSDANWYELFINGSTTRLTVPDTSAWLFEVQVVGITDDAVKQWGYTVVGLIERDGSDNTTLAGSSVTTVFESDADFDCRASADDTNEALLIEVQDATSGGDAVSWGARVSFTKISK